MKNIKKVTAAALSVLLVGSMTVPAFAQTAPSAKEEVIYVMTDAAGSVTDVEAVNIFDGGDITDYGDYSAVKVLNTTDPITQDGDKITLSSDAERVYYQGTMPGAELPWDISIRYFLDGQEYSADKLAGKSGALEIRFSVTRNESCKGSFYDGYALQASFTLDAALCQNIVCDGATVANVGGDKQLTYTILPGKGIDTSIFADVTDFEMDAAAINGVRMSMNIEVDDAALTDKIDELVSAIGDLDDGASDVRDGTGELYEATGTLSDKVGELCGGTGKLADGTAEFVDETSDMDTQISDEIDSLISSITGGDGETVSFVSDKNTSVRSVQFVIKTAAIEKAEPAAAEETVEAPLTFWQKLLRLFGLY